jgi:hypothetical protein
MKVQTVTAYRVSQLQRYGVTVRGNVTVCTQLNLCLSVHLSAFPSAWNNTALTGRFFVKFGSDGLNGNLSRSSSLVKIG